MGVWFMGVMFGYVGFFGDGDCSGFAIGIMDGWMDDWMDGWLIIFGYLRSWVRDT